MPYFGIFGLEFSKNYCHIRNQHPQIRIIAKFCEIMKMAKFGAKNALLRYFWARVFKKLLSYWKSLPSNLSISKILRKNNYV